jgi:cytochrome c-type biogenesis protein CcmH
MNGHDFVAGCFGGLALAALLTPWLSRLTLLQRSTATVPRAAATAAVLAAVAGGWALLQTSPSTSRSAAAGPPAGSFAAAARAIDQATAAPATGTAASGVPTGAAPAKGASAGSMENAIASLEARLAKGGGTPDDWELLAKSFEFIGRPTEAAKARAHQLPAPGAGAPAATPAGTAVTGEVSLDPALASRVKPGETLFIVAKSVDSPGPPVAVFRGSAGSWPMPFRLDDTQSMLPGRTLSGTHRVTIEARLSAQGQPLPASGDLQGSSGVIDPATATPLKIRIDKVLP